MRLALLLVAGCAASPPPRPAPLPGWPDLHVLAGAWTGTTGTTSVAVTFTPIANASALAEAFGPPGRQTMTLYHRDHDSLIATHYCAQGNQPRLRASALAGNRVVFTESDVTDLDPTEPHLVEMTIELGVDAFDREEVYRRPDGSLERTRWHFERAK